MNCDIIASIPEERKTYILIDVVSNNGTFQERYRLNFSESGYKGNKKISIFRDYMQEDKGYDIKNILIKQDSDISKIIKITMTQIRKDAISA